jgi:hypothetical protein
VDHLFIVSRLQPDLYRYLAREFSAESDVQVILDRRYRDRRTLAHQPSGSNHERRASDRRQRREVVGQLNTLGYAFVRLT